MTDLPIAPDESSGEPRCQRSCPSWGSTDAVRYGHCLHPEQGAQRVIGDLCLPRVRELVAISRRRCDGCRYWTRHNGSSGHCVSDGHHHLDGWYCGDWEAKP